MKASLLASLGSLTVFARKSQHFYAAPCAIAAYSRSTLPPNYHPTIPAPPRLRTYATDAASLCWSNSSKPYAIGYLSPILPKKKAKRLGRGPSSGRGGTSTRGHKGQKARRGNGKPTPGFEGGQTPLMRRYPKRGFVNAFAYETVPLNISRLQAWISAGRLDVSKPITVKELLESRCIHRMGDSGVKLLGEGADSIAQPIHVVVSRASASAIEAVEAAGGSITCVYYTPLSLRALVKPEKWTARGKIVPRQSLPVGKKDLMYYSDIRNRGYLAKMYLHNCLEALVPSSSETEKVVDDFAPKDASATLA